VSAEGGKKFAWLIQSYDKAILIVVLLALLISAALLVVGMGKVKSFLSKEARDLPAAQQHKVDPVDEEGLNARIAALSNPSQTPSRENQMMVSELRVQCVNPDCARPIPYHSTVCPFCKTPQPEIVKINRIDNDGDGIPDGLEVAAGLDRYDPMDARIDSDGDGFTNLEEYDPEQNIWKFDPNNPSNFPPAVAKLRLAKVKTEPFKLRFNGVQELPGGERRYLLNMKTLNSPSHFASMGDIVEGYKLVSLTNKTFKMRNGQESTKVVLTLENKGTLIELIKNKPRTRHERIALIISLIDRASYKKHVDDTIELKDRTYKVIDIRPDNVLIRDSESGKTTVVPRLTEDEIMALRGLNTQARNPDEESGALNPEGRSERNNVAPLLRNRSGTQASRSASGR